MTLSKSINQYGAKVQTDTLDGLRGYLGCLIEDLVEHMEAADQATGVICDSATIKSSAHRDAVLLN